MTKTVTVFGATGAQGAPVVSQALARGFTVHAFARDSNKISTMHPNAKAFAGSLDDKDAIARAFKNVDAAFVHLPMAQEADDSQRWLGATLEAAHEASLPLMVYSTSGPAGERFASSIVVDGTSAAANAVRNSGIPSIVLQPAIYLENLLPDVFVPNLRSQGVLDYPPMKASTKVQWTSHHDQALVAVAALARPDLAGNVYDIGSHGALTGAELARVVSDWVGQEVNFSPLTPAQFGARVGDALQSPGAAFALTDLYESLEKLQGDDMVVDTNALEQTFNVSLSSVEERIQSWTQN